MDFSLRDVSKSSQKLRYRHTQYLEQFLNHVVNIGSITSKQAKTRTAVIPLPPSVSSHVFSLKALAEMEICTGMTIGRQLEAEMRVVTHNPGLQCCITLRAPMHEAVMVVVLQVKEHT
jgi:hypothetical protein